MLGQKIGNYKVIAEIGAGGMGAVYRAVHETLGRSAAVKVLLPEISSSRDMVMRFFNEARSAASIRHPGIVETYDFGFLPDGRAYIIMEFLEGETLASRLQRAQRIPHVRALQIVRSVARALHAAHEGGIVHRDIKPDNIFLVQDPEMPTGERIKLLDFGIAKLGGDSADTGLTQTGTVMGTPTYMAPEQCRGAGAVDRRADLYALGCILYEMLCGRPPFLAEGAGDIIAHHLYFQPEPPRSHEPSIAPSLEALVMALLQKDPAHRPPTAQALVEAIDRLGVPAGGAPMQLGGAVTPPLGAPVSPPLGASQTTLSGASASVGTTTSVTSRRLVVVIAGCAVAAVAAVAIVAVVAGGDGSSGGATVVSAPQIGAPPASPPPVAPTSAIDAAVPPPPPVQDAMTSDLPADAAVAPDPGPPEPPPPDTAKSKPERPSPKPQTISATKLESYRLRGSRQITPDEATKVAIAKSGTEKLSGSYKLCVDAQGAISSVSQVKSIGFADYDAKVLGEMKQWAFKPYAIGGDAVPVCAVATVAYSQPSRPPLPSPSPSPPPPGNSTCTRSSFESVLQAKQPDEAIVQAALARLKRCQKDLAPDVYADLQQQLISKL